MGNEISYRENGYPDLTFESPPRHSQTTASLPDSFLYCPQRESSIRRQKSLPSEADYTDSSENSVVSRRRQCLGGNNASTWLRTIPGSSGTLSSDKSSLLEVIVKKIGGVSGGQNPPSSSDEDQARDVSSGTSLQNSACEILETSQQLTEEEKTQIKHVLDRVKQFEFRESERISNLEMELRQRESEVARRVVGSEKDIYGSTGDGCDFCNTPTNLDPLSKRKVEFFQCADCARRACFNCSYTLVNDDSADQLTICSVCQIKRKLVVSSGAWTRGSSSNSRELHKVNSYESYGAFYKNRPKYPRKSHENRLPSSKFSIVNSFSHQDSLQRYEEKRLPKITIESPKSLQFPDLLREPETHHLSSPKDRKTSTFEGEENLASSDSECPDTEGVKSMFLPGRVGPSPSSSFRNLSSTDIRSSSLHSNFSDDLLSAYYRDPWTFYGPEIIDHGVIEDQSEDEEEAFHVEEPPFGPISEEAEEELVETHQSISNNSIATTTSDSDFQVSRELSHTHLEPSNPLLTRHLSLDHIAEKHRIVKSTHSLPLLVSPYFRERIVLAHVSTEVDDSVDCEIISPIQQSLYVEPSFEEPGNRSLRAKLFTPPEIFVNLSYHSTEMDRHACALANWNQCGAAETEEIRVLAGVENDEEDEERALVNESRPMQIRRCKHFENINQLISAEDPLYPPNEEQSKGDNDNHLGSPAMSDGLTVHSWTRQPQHEARPRTECGPRLTLSEYAEDRVVLKHEEQIWARMFATSEGTVMESAKGFAAQLQELTHSDEGTAEMAEDGLNGLDKLTEDTRYLDNQTLVEKNGTRIKAGAEPNLLQTKLQLLPQVCGKNANLGGRLLPSLMDRDISEITVGMTRMEPHQDKVEQVTSFSTAAASGTNTPALPLRPRDCVTDTTEESEHRPLSAENSRPMERKEAREGGGVRSGGCSKAEDSSHVHRPKVTLPALVSSPRSHPSPTYPTSHCPAEKEKRSNVLLLPNSLSHLSSPQPLQIHEQSRQPTSVASREEKKGPTDLLTEPVRSQSVDQLPSLLSDSASPNIYPNRSGALGSCLWGALCRSKSRQLYRAIRTLTEGVDHSDSCLESTDALLSVLRTETNSLSPKSRIVSKTHRLCLTHICDTTIESGEQCSALPCVRREQHFEITTAQHLLYENPLFVSMTSALRSKRSQSYIAPSEYDPSYIRQQQHHAYSRLPDVPQHETSTTYAKHHSFTLSTMPRDHGSTQRRVENVNFFPSMWSPPPNKSISASLSPKHVRMKSSQLSSRPLFSKDNLTYSSSGFALRSSAPNGSYSRVNRHSGGVVDEYGSGDSGGSNSSYRKRLVDYKKPIKAPNSPRTSGEILKLRPGYDATLSSRSSTLPYKRRGSWHVDRQTDFPNFDLGTSRGAWSRSRWRSFSPDRLVVDTSHEGCSSALPSDTRSVLSQSLHCRHLKELTKSTEQLSTGFLDNYKGIETSFDTLRAKLDAASTSGFKRQVSADRLSGRDPTTEQLRRQCEREHRRLLKSLMYDSWEKSMERHQSASRQYFNQTPGVVLPVQEATLLTAPRTTNPLTNPNLEKLLRNPALMRLLANHASQTHQAQDQSSIADQVTLAAVAGAAAATAMANFANSGTEQPSYSNLPSQKTSTGDEYDWNDPETLMAAYAALAEASGGEKAFLEQLSPELAATLVHYREQLSEKLSAVEDRSEHVCTAIPMTTQAAASTGVVATSSTENGGYGNRGSLVLEDVSRQPGAEKDGAAPSVRLNISKVSSNDKIAQIKGNNKNPETTSTKSQRRTYDFPTKRLLLIRSSKGRSVGGNGFGLKIAGGRQLSDGRLGSYVEQIYQGETLSYLHGEIVEGDEVIEWNGIPLAGKGASEVQAIVDTPAEEVELLVRTNPLEPASSHRIATELPHHTCNLRSPCAADAHRYPPKLCPSHNPAPHLHESLHSSGVVGASAGLGGGVNSCVHQKQQHTCQQPQSVGRGLQMHTCEVHPVGPSCIHKPQHVCRPSDWSSPDLRGNYPQRSVVDQQAPNSPLSERNPSESSVSPSARKGSLVHRKHLQLVPTVNVAEYDVNSVGGRAVGRDTMDSESHNSRGQINEDSFANEADNTEGYGEIELILTFDDYDQSLTVHVARARGLRPMDLNGLADPFVKLRLHPDPTEDLDLNRQIKYITNTLEPEWQQTVVFMNCLKRTLKKRVLEVTVWDFDRLKMNDFMGQAIIHLGSKETLDGQPHWYKLHDLKDIVIPGYRQPGTRSVAPPISQSDQVKTIKAEVTSKQLFGKGTTTLSEYFQPVKGSDIKPAGFGLFAS